MTTLSEARAASRELQRLQQAASQLPELEKQEASHNSETRLEQLGVSVLRENTELYQSYLEVYSDFQKAFNAVLEAMGKASTLFRKLFEIRKQIVTNTQKYGKQWATHKIKFEGVSPYKVQLDQIQKEAEVSPGQLDLVLTPQVGNYAIDNLLRLLERF